MNRRLTLVALGAILVAWILWSALAEPDASRAPPPARDLPPDADAPVPPASRHGAAGPPAGTDEFEATLAALQLDVVGSAEDAAADLRGMLRLDATARLRAEETLLAPDTPRALRMALALVLGTLPDGVADTALLEALARFADDEEVVRCLLFALGATREPPEDDEIFGLGDRPWGVHGPGGLGITVRRAIEDPHVRAAIAQQLADPRKAVREAAAMALRHSLDAAEARTAVLATLQSECSDDVALVLGEALAVWAGTTADATAAGEAVTALLARAGEPGLDGYRFAMENDFQRLRLSDAQRATLVEYAHPAQPLEVRSFALKALAAAARHGGETGTRALLESLLEGDADDAVRDLSARLLGTLPVDGGTVAMLATAARADQAWNVRWQALDALAQAGSTPVVLETLRAASSDPEARVAAHARDLLERLAH